MGTDSCRVLICRALSQWGDISQPANARAPWLPTVNSRRRGYWHTLPETDNLLEPFSIRPPPSGRRLLYDSSTR